MNVSRARRFRFACWSVLPLLALCPALVANASAQGAIIVDHNWTTLSAVPSAWINAAKANLHIAYGHTSHGSQLTDGMSGLAAWKGSLYAWNAGGGGGALDLRDSPFAGASDLGNPNRTAWATATRSYLTANPGVNVIIWSWCGQVDGSQSEIQQYLDLMNQLEADFPKVRFVYMTGHLDGGGPAGNVNARNDQIREYCRTHNKILYDFADIESYDPDGLVNYMSLRANDNCDYDSNGDGTRDRNWCLDWQASHTRNVDWYEVSAAHSQALNGNRKAYAAWALWARLAGWDGSGNPVVGRKQPVYHSYFAVDTLETPYVGDFDGDGRTDIITFTRQNPLAVGDVYVSLSEGTRFGASAKWHDWFAVSTGEQVVIGDFDGDGDDDIATWLATTTRQVYVALSAGTSMGHETVWLSGIGSDATDVLMAGDANGDGRKDLYLFARRQGRVYVALSSGAGFAAPQLWHGYFAVSTYERPRVADLDGDGDDDILTLGTDSPTAQGDVYVALSDRSRFVSVDGVPSSSTKWHDWFAVSSDQQVRTGDLDGDGADDLFTFLPPPFGQCYTVRSQRTSLAPNVLWPEVVVPDSRDKPFVGDVNGDGHADVIVFAQGEGKVYVSLAP